mmetsp:Transcript_87612/g.256140  ORF Transcript_87612/g.256140 Transcript_87612/m.256140 type:complete len:287 (-) Transcript_87612:1195-2055(-)
MSGATKRPSVRPSRQRDSVGSELSLHPRTMAMQGDVVTLREVDSCPLFEGLRINDHAKVVAGRLIPHEAQQHPSVLSVAVGLRHKNRLPRQLTRDVLLLPLQYLMGLMVLLRQPQHPMVVDDTEAELMPPPVNLGIDLGLVKAVVRPSSPRALPCGDVHAEALDLAAAPTPVLDVPGARLPQGKANRRLFVADDIEIHDIAVTLLRLEGVDCVEEEEWIRLKNGCVLTGLPVNQADESWPLRLPRVVVVQVSLVLASEQPLSLCIEHAIPVEGIRDLDHDNILFSQ